MINLAYKELGQGAVVLTDQFIVSATNFLTGVIIGRTCSKGQFGIYILGLSIVLFLTSVQNSLISSPYTVFSPRLKKYIKVLYTGSTLVHQLGLSFIGVILLLIVATLIPLFKDIHGLKSVLGAIVLAITFILLREYARRYYFASLKIKYAIVVDFSVSIIQISTLLYLANNDQLSASRSFLVIGSSCGIISTVWIFHHIKNIKLKADHIISDFFKNWSFGKWVFAGNLTILVASQLYPWFLTSIHGSEMTGIFAACWTIVSLVNPVLFGIGNILGPKTAHAYASSPNKLEKLILYVTITLIILMTFFCIIIFLFGEYAITTVYGVSYKGNWELLLLLSLGITFGAISKGYDYGIWAMEFPNINFKINLFSLIITLTIGLYFVNRFGLLGTAYGLILGNTISSVLRYFNYKKILRYRIRNYVVAEVNRPSMDHL